MALWDEEDDLRVSLFGLHLRIIINKIKNLSLIYRKYVIFSIKQKIKNFYIESNQSIRLLMSRVQLDKFNIWTDKGRLNHKSKIK